MAYRETILDFTAIRQVGGSDILIPALCRVEKEAERQIGHGSGKREAYDLAPGNLRWRCRVEESVLYVGMEDIIEYALSDSTTKKMKKVEVDNGLGLYTGYISSLRLRLRPGEFATISLDIEAESEDETEISGEPTYSDGYFGKGVSLSGFPSSDCADIELTINNTVNSRYSAKGSILSPILAQGYINIEGTIRYLEDPAVDITTIETIASGSIIIKSASGSKTLTLSLTDILISSVPTEPEEEGLTEYTLTFSAKDMSVSVV